MEIRGVLHDGSTSRSREASLRFYPDGSVRMRVDGEERTLSFQDLRIPSRLGSTPRRIRLADGGELEVADNDAVDAVLDAYGPRAHDWLHRLESRLPLVAAATLLVLAAGALFVWRGVPAIARQAAFSVSPELASRLGEGTLEVLERTLEPTALSEARQGELRAAFDAIVAQAEPGHAYRLLFRGGGMIGANAFALPSGTVVLTDELVALAGDDREVVAVLAHEVGHVVHRHGLRQAIQSSMLAIGVLLVTGDLSSTSGFVAALPAALAETHYSRDFEREADAYAMRYLTTRDMDPCHLGSLLRRMEEESGGGAEIPFLSTHPATRERVEALGGACS